MDLTTSPNWDALQSLPLLNAGTADLISGRNRPTTGTGLVITGPTFDRMRCTTWILAACFSALAANAAAQINAYVEPKVFFDPDKGTVVDVNLAIIGSTVLAMPNAHGFHQARVEATTIISRDGAVVDFRKTEVLGPEYTDTLARDFIHQERFAVAPGAYDLEVELKDMSATLDALPRRYKGPLVIADHQGNAWFSDVLLIEAPDAGSTALVPFIGTYFPSNVGSLAFHAELYNSDRAFGTDSLFLLTYRIVRYEDRQTAGSFRKQTRSKAAQTLPVTAQFDISALPSGNYLLVFEAADKRGSVIATRDLFFQRNNPVTYDMTNVTAVNTHGTFVDAMTDPDTLAENIHCLRPIASDLERKIIDDRWKDRDIALMKSFFFSFWYNRNGYDPEGSWRRYEALVAEVNRIYGCRIRKGYETDRGYVHLKYGPPNTIMDQANDASGYPYQIWHYYRAGKYSDKRFVFYLPDRVTSCYELLHSEVPGEIKTPNWNQLLHAQNTGLNNVQSTDVPLGHGEQVQDFFNTPR